MSQTFFMIICSKVYFAAGNIAKKFNYAKFVYFAKIVHNLESPHLKAEGGYPIDGWRPLWLPSPQGANGSKDITRLSYASLRRFSSRFQSEEFFSSYLWVMRIQKVQLILMDVKKREVVILGRTRPQ
jgi:hypothetical protein